MEEVFKVAAAIILSFGGSGVILLGLSSWLGKIWASRILEKEKKEHILEIEDYKSKLQANVNRANSIIDKSVFVTKLQYDKEFSIYLEIWEKLAKCVISTKNLYPIFENVPRNKSELKDFNKKKWSAFAKDYNAFSDAIIKYAPFYEEKLNERFIELRKVCSEQASLFEIYALDPENESLTSENRRKVYIEFPEKIDELQSSLTKEIRTHLKSLQTIED
ncbi:hypothetical protein M3689_01150 [Alkalihalophilus marmarensis]|uniref:hypothetical protein n=1 Tax=Alkalihalophilus marmarensis TaxID=521377 RepID=UPI00204144D3|nr:hypothetical protein [Alkalihalophilus marmarensis]MCM3487906.1 hypothetical protein [Alkalihalophilus marmarensis]